MMPDPDVRTMYPIRGSSTVRFLLVRDQLGTIWLHLTCVRCGDRTKKPCTGEPVRVDKWNFYYAGMHVH